MNEQEIKQKEFAENSERVMNEIADIIIRAISSMAECVCDDCGSIPRATTK